MAESERPDSSGIILFTGNCFGEDRSAALVAVELIKLMKKEDAENCRVMGSSLISPGDDYTSRNIDLLFSSALPPSGGFPTHSIKGFFADLFDGNLAVLRRYRKKLKEYKHQIKLVIVAGDVPLLWLTRRELKEHPFLFLDLPKSDYIEPHYGIEKKYIRKACDRIFTRDKYTADNMAKEGLPVEFLGNPIMDGLTSKRLNPKPEPGKPLVALLPGSRDEAYDNFLMMLSAVELAGKVADYQFYAALPGSLTNEKIEQMVGERHWEMKQDNKINYLEKSGVKVILSRGMFSGVLHAADAVLGLAGTANEQAVGLGKPVIAFKGAGPQTTKRRFREQGRLLGKGLIFVDGGAEAVAGELVRLIDSPEERLTRSRDGMAHMGEPGGAKRLAKYIFDHYIKLKG